MEYPVNFESVDELIWSFLKGTITPEEKRNLKAWLSESSSNREYFREIYLLWKAGSVLDLNRRDEKITTALHHVHSQILEGEKDSAVYKPSGKYVVLSKLKLAAVIIITLGLGSLMSYLFLDNSSSIDSLAINVIKVPLGSKSIVVLPDKTEVCLNAGSKLTYSKAYGEKFREVNFEGEGYFKVAKMPQKPFIVHTKRANIKALGTEFNVKAYPEENTIETILVKGSVIVNKIQNSGDDKNSQSIVLKPGQKVLIYKDETKPETDTKEKQGAVNNARENTSSTTAKLARKELEPITANAEVETSWKEPSWVIQGEGIEELFVKIGRRYNVTIDLKDKELDQYKFSAIIKNETLEQVFDLMSLTIPLSYKIEKGYVAITLNKKLEKQYKRAYY